MNAIADEMCKNIHASLAKKEKKLEISKGFIKNHLWIFVNCLIVNPTFDS